MNDTGYSRLRAALDEANAANGDATNAFVTVSVAGPNSRTWDQVTGDHVERDGRLHLGGGIIVRPDSTILDADHDAEGGTLGWRGGHAMENGDRTERFTLDGTAMTVTWRNTVEA